MAYLAIILDVPQLHTNIYKFKFVPNFALDGVTVNNAGEG